MDELFNQFPVKIIERSSAGLFTKLPSTLDCGMNIIYVVQKN